MHVPGRDRADVYFFVSIRMLFFYQIWVLVLLVSGVIRFWYVWDFWLVVNFRFTKLVRFKIWRYRRTIWFKVLLELWNCCIHRICSEHWYRIFPRFFTFWLQILLVLIFHLIKAKNSRLKSSLNLNLNVYVGDKIQKNDTPFLPPKYL